jgi:transcriptional regulator with XRE-family HTH domain
MGEVEDQVAGALLKSARGRLGLSQHAFADLLGVAQPTLSAYESGRRQPTLPTLLRLLAKAGLELRIQLANRDNHDHVLADWERSLSEEVRARLRAQGYRLVSDAAWAWRRPCRRDLSDLRGHGVEFVVIGGVAARLHEAGHATVDIDLCPSRTKDNLIRLAQALKDLGARLRVEGDSERVAFEPHEDLLANVTTMTLVTRHGPLDLCFTPAGFTGGYDELAARLIIMRRGDVDIPVASLEDVIVSKQTAGRPKDVAALPALEAHLRRLRRDAWWPIGALVTVGFVSRCCHSNGIPRPPASTGRHALVWTVEVDLTRGDRLRTPRRHRSVRLQHHRSLFGAQPGGTIGTPPPRRHAPVGTVVAFGDRVR